MKLELPRTVEHEALKMEGYTLFILSDGTMYLNEERVRVSNLPERLREIAPTLEDRGLILKADDGVRYGLVIEVMDLAKQSGVEKLVVATRPKEDER